MECHGFRINLNLERAIQGRHIYVLEEAVTLALYSPLCV